MCSICIFFSDFSDDSKDPNPSNMIGNFSNFQHGAHHDGGTSDVMGVSWGVSDVTGGHHRVSPLPNLHNLQSII